MGVDKSQGLNTKFGMLDREGVLYGIQGLPILGENFRWMSFPKVLDPRSVGDPNYGALGTRLVRYLMTQDIRAEIGLVSDPTDNSDYHALVVRAEGDGEVKMIVSLGEIAMNVVKEPGGASGAFPKLAQEIFQVLSKSA